MVAGRQGERDTALASCLLHKRLGSPGQRTVSRLSLGRTNGARNGNAARMTSAAPARKPYRKAPPQHREVRHNPPVFREDLGGTGTDRDRGRGRPPAGALPGNSPPKPRAPAAASRAPQGPLPQVPRRPRRALLLPWSLASDSELDVSSLSSLDLTVLPPPRIFSHSAAIAVSQTKGMSRFISRSEDLLALSGEDERPPCSPSQSRSLERSLGILKQPNTLGVRAENLRKSKSAEVLGQKRPCNPSPKSMSLEREQGSRDQARSPPEQPAPPSPVAHLARGRGTGAEAPAPGGEAQVLPVPGRDHVPRPEPGPLPAAPRQAARWREGWSEPAAPSPPARQPDPKEEGGTERKSRRAREDSAERPRPHTWHVPLRGRDGSDGEPEPERRRVDARREGARPKAEGQTRAGESRGSSEADWEDETQGAVHLRKHRQHQSQLDGRTSQRDAAEKPDAPKHAYPVPHIEGDEILGIPFSVFSQTQDSLCDADRIKILQQQNEDLRRRLTHTTHKMEAMETEFQSSRHFMQAEMGRTKDDLEKMRDKFRRLQNSYTASQRANQDLEEKLHALLRKVERDKKTMDQEIVELTNKLLDAKNTIDKLEELNERYRQDCNLAVQLLKCNKSHFRNHKFADLPYELQDMVNKHMKSSLPGKGAQAPDADSMSLTPADVVPTSVIARVLEKPEPLVLKSAQSCSSTGRPVAEDVFVHVDMTGPPGEGRQENGGQGLGRPPSQDQQLLQQNGMSRSQSSLDGQSGEEGGPTTASFEKLNPYPTPPPPHPLYPGRKVIEFSSDDKVKIPKNSPLPNCTYATRQAISLSLVQSDEAAGERQRTVPNSPGRVRRGLALRELRGGPPGQLAAHVRGEDGPVVGGTLVNRTSFSSETIKDLEGNRNGKAGGERGVHRGAYSDGEESSPQSWTVSRESSLDTDTSSADLRGRKGQYGGDFSQEESEQLLMSLDPLDDGDSCDTAVTVATALEQASPGTKRKEYVDAASAGSSTEERDILPQDFPAIAPRVLAGLEDCAEKPPLHAQAGPHAASARPQKSPKRMGVHHLHRKDSLTRAQEHGNLLD
ncbi:hypothetical protein AAFF_G00140310 [Aldrovandia affinis]|uniref:Tight junction-associated protein 1 domain-containing protein n=1 Tax=Aldrovandia affinis TaxID=143900 RepID=A0AAD7TCA2_9TELE|nr:hypothetical protein AAFF_G00140310 [Aldrovandia affinis]